MYKICNCTLSYSNPKACLNCSNNKNLDNMYVFDFIDSMISEVIYNDDFTVSFALKKQYNPETHELVEKPEAKLKRLNSELSGLEYLDKSYDESLKDLSKVKVENLNKIKKIKEELNNLK